MTTLPILLTDIPDMLAERPDRRMWASYSQLTTHRACPQRWFYGSVLKLGRAEDPNDPKVELNFGLWWHARRLRSESSPGPEYVAVHGPSYETPAEIRAFRVMGADAVGMSTAPEAIVARQMGLEVLGISCISNPAAGVVDAPLNHEDVMAVTTRVRGQFIQLLEGVVGRL